MVEKMKRNSNYVYDVDYDKVTEKQNIELYEKYIDKFSHKPYSLRPTNPTQTLQKGRERFEKLGIFKQAETLLNIQTLFCNSKNGADLKSIGGGTYAGKSTLSANVSNWAKLYSDVRIIDASASGLWEKRSENLLKLL